MRHAYLALGFVAALAGVIALGRPAFAEPVHAISMHGEPALPEGFDHLPYVNPDAPEGGSVTYGVVGSFDSLNPFILKSMRTTARGVVDPEFGNLVFETLMFRSADEPFTLYGLLAESVEWDEDRTWITFHINPEARWSDGEPVTADDVIFTFELFRDHARPPYSQRLDKVERMVKLDENSVKFVLNEKADRETPLIIAGYTPILPEHAIDPETFDQSTLEPLIGSGPYVIHEVNPGRSITYRRDPDYWGADLPVKRGFDNYDEITIEYFLSDSALFEAFKKGIFDIYPDGDPTHWERAYDFPAVESGDVVKETFKRQVPSNMFAFVFNTRRPVFQDEALREAIIKLFDFQAANRILFSGAYERTESFFQNSDLSSVGVPAGPKERELLAPFKDAIPASIMDGTYRLPVTDGSGRNRELQREAFGILREAGYRIENGRLLDPEGQPVSFEIMTRGAGEDRLALALQADLRPFGIEVRIRSVDDAQYQKRLQTYDYDMIMASYSGTLSPGTEQIWRWSSRARDVPGTFNYAGAADPAIDAMIDALLNARTAEDFQAAVRAYDRALIAGHYVVPLYYTDRQRVARWKHIKHPDRTPIYGYQLSTWWDARAKTE